MKYGITPFLTNEANVGLRILYYFRGHQLIINHV